MKVVFVYIYIIPVFQSTLLTAKVNFKYFCKFCVFQHVVGDVNNDTFEMAFFLYTIRNIKKYILFIFPCFKESFLVISLGTFKLLFWYWFSENDFQKSILLASYVNRKIHLFYFE